MLQYKNIFEKIGNLNFIEENNIGECLSKTKLVISDYSSIIFDMIYQRKPYIIYIPDAKDNEIKENYLDISYNINNEFKFENVFLDIRATINKINYYIDNNFKLDRNLRKFYNTFNFTKSFAVDDLINSLLNIKYNDKTC